MDVLTKKQRSFNMSQIRSKNTSPEITVRSLVHRMGYRYGLHRSDLPGHPDIVLVKYKKIVFVHGCFWHMHRCRFGRVIPATRTNFWQNKRRGNVSRDKCNSQKLKTMGWKILIVWECQMKDAEKLTRRLQAFLK
ncbi:MAG: DNA mismatch endonuclease Vsr [Planctomycetes bacterium]|nr:DNA mismatch endonuclease Vsr [Planctomycetota bacterium]